MEFELKLDSRFKRSMRARFEDYEIEVGILKDKAYKQPARWQMNNEMNTYTGSRQSLLQYYAGGLIRKKTRKDSGKTIADVSEANRERLGVNFYTKPFRDGTKEVEYFVKNFFNYAFGRSTEARLKNSLQACVRNPILRGEYGPQSSLSTAIKGFYRPMIDTAQLFKAIEAKVKKVGGNV